MSLNSFVLCGFTEQQLRVRQFARPLERIRGNTMGGKTKTKTNKQTKNKTCPQELVFQWWKQIVHKYRLCWMVITKGERGKQERRCKACARIGDVREPLCV